jgi:hypothetical protein
MGSLGKFIIRDFWENLYYEYKPHSLESSISAGLAIEEKCKASGIPQAEI